MRTDAYLSADRKYRFWLLREWDKNLPVVAFIGLNPSTADENSDDATIRKCVKFAKSWGCGSILMLNLYAFRATDPKDLWAARKKGADIVGIYENNCERICEYLAAFNVSLCVGAWGKGKQSERASGLRRHIKNVMCLNRNKDGSPAHPLYQLDTCVPIPLWEPL